ncbi:MAG: hypothetical protein ORN49_00800, partial [Rhodobacteraceae bacterium]|nr:hypothetical protein [Paracoccaceae bacterium]
MTSLSGLFDAYLDVNILLAFACALWMLTTWLLRRLGLGHSYTAQLKTLRLVFLAIVLSPLLVGAAMVLADRLGVSLGRQLNLADLIVAQYLQGRFEMDPARLETILGARRQLAVGQAPGGLLLILAAGFALGFVLFTARLLASMWKLRRLLDESFVWRRFGKLDLRLSDRTTVPFS